MAAAQIELKKKKKKSLNAHNRTVSTIMNKITFVLLGAKEWRAIAAPRVWSPSQKTYAFCSHYFADGGFGMCISELQCLFFFFCNSQNIPAACKMKCWNLRHDANLKTE